MWTGVIVGGVLLGGLALAARWPVVNDVETGKSAAYPDLQPRSYPQERDRVFEAALSTAQAQRGWRVTLADATSGEISAVAHVVATPFRDDVTIRVIATPNETTVTLRSRSRVGRTDLGVNARRIRGYLRALDAALTRK